MTPIPELGRWGDLPGVVIELVQLSGGTGTGGNFVVGDKPVVKFRVKRNDGSLLRLSELDSASMYISGPTTGYQRVIASQSNVRATAVDNLDGTYTYTFAVGIPAAYLAPLNDTASFGAADGEKTGVALEDGTYTLGFQAYKNYNIEGVTYRDAGNLTHDFLFGAATSLVAREVVGQANCNACHTKLAAHGGSRVEVGICLLCHTAGSEDKNVPTVEGGTPGVSIDFDVMIHRIHNGEHLPSVVGVTTKTDGSGERDYTPASKPYKLVGYNNGVTDFSHVGFPVMPSAYVAYLYDQAGTTYVGAAGNGPMPRDTGWSALSSSAKHKEDEIRTGVVACAKCHGDPDGAGPAVAPAQGGNHETTVTRKTCGACHDDVIWTEPYKANGLLMPAQADDLACSLCHPADGINSLAVRQAHLHPYNDPTLNTGVNLTVTGLAAGSGPGGKHAINDPFEVTFTVKNDAGADLPVSSLTRLQAIVVGPTSNTQIILPNANPYDFTTFRKSTPFSGSGTISSATISAGAVAQTIGVVFTSATTFDVVGSVSSSLTGQAIGGSSGNTAAVTYNGVSFTITQGATPFSANDRFYFEVVPPASSYTLKVPLDVTRELIGVADGNLQVLTVGNLPLYWGRQTVWERTVINAGTGLTMSSAFLQRYVELDADLVSGIAVGDIVVIDAGSAGEEYAQVGHIQKVDDRFGLSLGDRDRLWFTTPLRYAHAVGAQAQEVTLSSRREGTHYAVTDAANGQITLNAGSFTAGNPVVVSYRTWGRFGWKRSPADTVQAVFPAPIADTDGIDESWGDWKGLPILDGTYTVGMWANRDFTVTPLGVATTTTSWNNWATDNTTYRMMAKPATQTFLFGAATTIEPREIIVSGETCNSCHSDIAAHGFGRRGLETCLLCHTSPGVEDGPKFSYDAWYVGRTPGISMDFRSLLHKVHAGKDLSQSYVVNGVFLGTPYPVEYSAVVFPAAGGTADCERCHGAGSTSWMMPESREHPLAPKPVQTWAETCGSCHDGKAAQAHFNAESWNGYEACEVCHGPGSEYPVDLMHKIR